MDSIALKVNSIGKKFGALVALNNVSFDLKDGEIMGVIGPNGAGKSTMFSVLTGFISPSSGSWYIKDQEITNYSPEKICHMGMARTFQIAEEFHGQNVIENVMIATSVNSKNIKQAEANAAEALRTVGLIDKAYYQGDNLTIMDRQKLELAKVYASGANILLLDEILTGLRPREITATIDTLLKIKEKRQASIIIVEHILNAILTLSDSILVLNFGEVLCSGNPDDVIKDTRVREVYIGNN